MQSLTLNEGVERAFDSLQANRLTVLAGAGLSRAAPSLLPTAADIAAEAKRRYDALYGATRPPLATGVEEQAEFFFQRGELDSVYFRQLIDRHAFAGRPNSGHFAAADFLLVGAVRSIVTTNVDTLIENAGQELYGAVGVALDGHEVSTLGAGVVPFLKLHGCFVRDLPNMVWAPGQLNAGTVKTRIEQSKTFLLQGLLNQDILIVGFWTDWDYLNQVLDSTLGAVTPSRVFVIDPGDPAQFPTKAPQLHALGSRATVEFRHIRVSGSAFLDALRIRFSQSIVRGALSLGIAEFKTARGVDPDAKWLDVGPLDAETLWLVRRDIAGRYPGEPLAERVPPANESIYGLTVFELRAAGAVQDGNYWTINGKRVRLFRASNQMIHTVEARLASETPPAVAPDLAIALGAERIGMAANIARAGIAPTIARGAATRWVTRSEARTELSF